MAAVTALYEGVLQRQQTQLRDVRPSRPTHLTFVRPCKQRSRCRQAAQASLVGAATPEDPDNIPSTALTSEPVTAGDSQSIDHVRQYASF